MEARLVIASNPSPPPPSPPPSPPPLSFSSLPDLVLVKIFSFLPLSSRLHFESISPRFRNLSRLSWMFLPEMSAESARRHFSPDFCAGLIDNCVAKCRRDCRGRGDPHQQLRRRKSERRRRRLQRLRMRKQKSAECANEDGGGDCDNGNDGSISLGITVDLCSFCHVQIAEEKDEDDNDDGDENDAENSDDTSTDRRVSDVTWNLLLRQIYSRGGESSLRRIDLRDASINPKTLKLLIEYFGSGLKTLLINNGLNYLNTTVETLLPVAERCASLVEFSVHAYLSGYINDAVEEALPHLLRNCRSLRQLDLSMCYGLERVDFSEARLNTLVSVNLARCMSLEDAVLESLVGKCSESLRVLDLSECGGLTKEGLKCLRRCRHLKNLSMRKMKFVKAEILEGGVGKQILVHPQLEVLDVSFNEWLTKELVEEVIGLCDRLEKLNIFYCGDVDGENLGSFMEGRNLEIVS